METTRARKTASRGGPVDAPLSTPDRRANGFLCWKRFLAAFAAALVGFAALLEEAAAQSEPIDYTVVSEVAENRWTQISAPKRGFRVIASPIVLGFREGRVDWLDNERILFTGASRIHCPPGDDRCTATLAVQMWTLGSNVRPLILSGIPCVDILRKRIALLQWSEAEAISFLPSLSEIENELNMEIAQIPLSRMYYQSKERERISRARAGFLGLAGLNKFSCGPPSIDADNWRGVFAELHIDHGHLVWNNQPASENLGDHTPRMLSVRSLTGTTDVGIPASTASPRGLFASELAFSAFDNTYFLIDHSFDATAFADESGKLVDAKTVWRDANCRRYWVFSHASRSAQAGCIPFVENGQRAIPARGLVWVEAREPFRPRNQLNGLHWFEYGQTQAYQAFRGLTALTDPDRGGSTSVSPSGCRTAFTMSAERNRRLFVVEHC